MAMAMTLMKIIIIIIIISINIINFIYQPVVVLNLYNCFCDLMCCVSLVLFLMQCSHFISNNKDLVTYLLIYYTSNYSGNTKQCNAWNKTERH